MWELAKFVCLCGCCLHTDHIRETIRNAVFESHHHLRGSENADLIMRQVTPAAWAGPGAGVLLTLLPLPLVPPVIHVVHGDVILLVLLLDLQVLCRINGVPETNISSD